MPCVLAFNKRAIEERIGRLAAYLDLPSHSFSGLLDWVLALRAEIAIHHWLDGLKPGIDRFDEIARTSGQKRIPPLVATPSCLMRQQREQSSIKCIAVR